MGAQTDSDLKNLEGAKKMAEKVGVEPSIILLVKSRLKRCFIPPFERKFLKF